MWKAFWVALAAALAMTSWPALAWSSTPELIVSCGRSVLTERTTFTEFPPGLGETVRGLCQDKGDEYGPKVRMTISGEITPRLAAAAIEILRVAKRLRKPPLDTVRVMIDSNGGDVESALTLGRAMFDQGVSVSTPRCYSACVLAIAGATSRYYMDLGGLAVGVHRPFQTQVLRRSGNAKELTSKYDAAEQKIRSWFREMGVSQQVADLMMSTPSTTIRLLTAQERSDFGLGNANVTHSEMLREQRVEGCDPDQAQRLEAAWSEMSECWKQSQGTDDAFTACTNAANSKYSVKLGQKCSPRKP